MVVDKPFDSWCAAQISASSSDHGIKERVSAGTEESHGHFANKH
jgi:hypothetical protein